MKRRKTEKERKNSHIGARYRQERYSKKFREVPDLKEHPKTLQVTGDGSKTNQDLRIL